MDEWIAKPDSWIAIAGTLIGVIGLWLSWKSRRRRIIRYGFIIRRQIFSNLFVKQTPQFDLKLNGQPVRELYLVELYVQNAGNEPLREADFLRPFRLSFNKVVTILPLQLTRNKKDIPTSYTTGEQDGKSYLELTTTLIETGDTIRITFIYESESYADYKLDGRIVDGRIVRLRMYEEELEEDFRYRAFRRYKHYVTPIAMFVTISFFWAWRFCFDYFWPTNGSGQNELYWHHFVALLVGFIVGSIIGIKITRHWEQKEIKKRVAEIEERDRALREKTAEHINEHV